MLPFFYFSSIKIPSILTNYIHSRSIIEFQCKLVRKRIKFYFINILPNTQNFWKNVPQPYFFNIFSNSIFICINSILCCFTTNYLLYYKFTKIMWKSKI